MNRTRVIESSGDRVTWTYDSTYQLQRERRSGVNSYDVTHTYDAAGNRTLKLDSGARTTAVYDVANRLTYSQDGTGRTTYTYDADGNQTRQLAPGGGRTTSVWNYENMNTVVQLPAGTRVTCTYDGAQQRTQKATSTATRRLVYDGKNVLVEADGSNVSQAVYTWEPNEYGNLVSQRQLVAAVWNQLYYHFDALGSSVARNGRAVDSVVPWCRATGAGVKIATIDQPGTTGKHPAFYAGRPASRRGPSRPARIREAWYWLTCRVWLASRIGQVWEAARCAVAIDLFGGRRRSTWPVGERNELRTCRQSRRPGQRAPRAAKERKHAARAFLVANWPFYR